MAEETSSRLDTVDVGDSSGWTVDSTVESDLFTKGSTIIEVRYTARDAIESAVKRSATGESQTLDQDSAQAVDHLRAWLTGRSLPSGSGQGKRPAKLVDHVERRLSLWPDRQTRAEAARLFVTEGKELGEVLRRYPNEVPYVFRGKPSRADRRAMRAHYALLQEAVGTPDIDVANRAAVERVIREEGVEPPITGTTTTGLSRA